MSIQVPDAKKINPAPTFSIPGGYWPLGVTFDVSTGALTGTPEDGTGGTYPVTIMASNGFSPNATQNFTLTVNEAPGITVQPGNQTALVGQTATFNAAANGYPAPTVQWQLSTNSGADWDNISGATSTTYTISATTSSMNGYQYRAVFHNTTAPDATSNAATLTVNAVGISLDSPAACSAGTICTISRKYLGDVGLYVRIELLKSGQPVRTIANRARIGTAGVGSTTWKPQPKLGDGSNYSIRITSKSNTLYTDDSEAFTIGPRL